jgi:hypothetical protein
MQFLRACKSGAISVIVQFKTGKLRSIQHVQIAQILAVWIPCKRSASPPEPFKSALGKGFEKIRFYLNFLLFLATTF